MSCILHLFKFNFVMLQSFFYNHQTISYFDLIYIYSTAGILPKITLLRKSTQGSLEEQMFHNRRTLLEITELREDNIEDNVIPLFILSFLCFI
jgi:hypothetical protein